ncbi:MAG: DUF4287 domain-containing protein [Gammaproteobacteria bacterium]
MATPDEMAATMLRNLPDKTGKSLKEWHKLLKQSSLEKHGELVKFLKTDHGVTHGFANLIVVKFRDSGTQSTDDLVDAQYAGAKSDLKPIYDALVKAVQGFGSDVELAPKKAYVSLRRKKQFGLIQPSTKTRVDVGMNLGAAKSTKRLEKSGSFNAMVSHRVRIESVDDIDQQLIGWLKKAYGAAK